MSIDIWFKGQGKLVHMLVMALVMEIIGGMGIVMVAPIPIMMVRTIMMVVHRIARRMPVHQVPWILLF